MHEDADFREQHTRPLFPPSAGIWLARKPQGELSPVYLHQLGDAEVREIEEALTYFRGITRRPGVESLLRSYSSWKDSMAAAARSRYLGPVVEGFAMRALEDLLPKWRMALDFLRGAVYTEFGKASVEGSEYRAATHRAYDTYFGYRIVEALRNEYLHHSIPPLRQDVRFDVITCDRCGEEHHVNPQLVLELPTTYVLGLKNCPAVLKGELPDRPPYLDLMAAVTEAMRGFFDVLFSVALLDPATPARADVLVAVIAEVAPDRPSIVQYSEETGQPAIRYRAVDGVDWVYERRSKPPKD